MNIKKTYIPSRPRNEKIINQTSVSGIFGGDSSQIIGSSHEHSNKSILDQISEKDITVLSLLSFDEVNNKLKVDTDLYSTGEVSAYGAGTGGSGTSYNRLDSWSDYTSDKAGWVLSALLGNDLNTRLSNVEGGSATSISITGSGNAITNASKSGNIITFTKGLTFSESTHNHDGVYLKNETDPIFSVHTVKNIVNGTGFLKNNGSGTWSYDNNSYALASHNHSGVYEPLISKSTGYLYYNGSAWAFKNETYSLSTHTHLASAITQDASHRFVTDTEKNTWNSKENNLGNPSSNGYLLSSTTAGVRSWVAPYSHPTYSLSSTTSAVAPSHGGTFTAIDSVTVNSLGHITALNTKTVTLPAQYVHPTQSALSAGGTRNFLTGITVNTLGHVTAVLSAAMTKADIEALLTGTITSHNHDSQYYKKGELFELKGSGTTDDPYRIEAKYNFYSIGEVSAFGAGTGGGGTSFNRLDAWADYTSDKSGWVLSALLGNDLNTRVSNIEANSALNISLTGAGNAITSVSKSGNTLTFAKGSTFSLSTHNHDTVYKPIGYVPSWSEITGKPSTFAPSSHTHTIANVTGLQSALDGKQPTIPTGTTSQYYRGDKTWQTLNTSVVPEGNNLYFTNARVKAYGDTLYSPLGHTHTFAQITGLQGALDSKATQSDIDTAIDNLEIGGRNLIIKSATTKGYYNQQGVFTDYPNTWISGFIEVTEGEEYTAKSFYSVPPRGGRLVYFDANKTYITRGELELEETFVIPVGVGYIRYQSDKPGGVYVDDAIIVKGNKAPTDWTPAPEDQVSDWSVTDVNSFAFIKNKPTQLSQFTDNIGVASHIANKANPHNVTTAQIGAVDLTTNQTIGGVKTFTDNVTAPTFVGALSGNASSATKLQTARTIWGQSFDGTGNVSGALSGATTGSFSVSVSTPKVDFGNGFTIEPSGTELVFKYNGVIKQRMLSDGTIVATGEVTAFVAAT